MAVGRLVLYRENPLHLHRKILFRSFGGRNDRVTVYRGQLYRGLTTADFTAL
jgi:hypothetical protein